MVGLCVAELGEAVGTDVRPVTGLPWIFYLIRALPRDIAGVPPGAGWTILSFLSERLSLFFLLLLDLLGNGLDGLHHAGRVHLVGDVGPGDVPMIQVTENPGIIVPGPVPGVGGVVSIGGEHGSEFQEVEEVLQTTIKLTLGHPCNMTLS